MVRGLERGGPRPPIEQHRHQQGDEDAQIEREEYMQHALVLRQHAAAVSMNSSLAVTTTSPASSVPMTAAKAPCHANQASPMKSVA